MSATGVFTEAFREKYAQLAGDLLTANEKSFMPLVWFKVGEGGYDTVSGNKVPKTPDSTKTDVEATIISTNTVNEDPLGCYFTKLIGVGNVVVSGSQVTITCTLDATEADLDSKSNLTGNLNGDPELFELGIYDGDPLGSPDTLLAYCTFDAVIKRAGFANTFTITLNY